MMGKFPNIFNDHAAGDDGGLRNSAELARQVIEQSGATGIVMERMGEDDPRSLKGKEKRERREARQRTALQRLLADPAFAAAYGRYQDTVEEANHRLAVLYRDNEDRREWLLERLNSPDADLTAAQRKRYEEELERRDAYMERIQAAQQHIDEQTHAVENGKITDPNKLDQMARDLDDMVEKLEQDMANRANPQSTAEIEPESVGQKQTATLTIPQL